MAEREKHWMKNLHMQKGALHKQLGVPADKKIPEAKLEKAEHSSNKKEAARARLAEVFKHSKH